MKYRIPAKILQHDLQRASNILGKRIEKDSQAKFKAEGEPAKAKEYGQIYGLVIDLLDVFFRLCRLSLRFELRLITGKFLLQPVFYQKIV